MGALGQELSAEQAAQIVVDEIGPCWSRWADDCMDLSDEFLRERGLYPDCERLIGASEALTSDEWYGVVDQLPYCDRFFDYANMPEGGGHPQASAESTIGKATTSSIVTGAVAVGMMVLGIVIGRATK